MMLSVYIIIRRNEKSSALFSVLKSDHWLPFTYMFFFSAFEISLAKKTIEENRF